MASLFNEPILTITMEPVEEKLAGRAPLVIGIEGLPQRDKATYIVQLGVPFSATIDLAEVGSVTATGIMLSAKDALSLAVRLTELVGPLDAED
jgi:hypothetical protein